MTPMILFVGVVILVLAALLGLHSLGHKGRGSRRLHMRITLVPPSIDLDLEQRSE
jgi:hypothetical protein